MAVLVGQLVPEKLHPPDSIFILPIFHQARDESDFTYDGDLFFLAIIEPYLL